MEPFQILRDVSRGAISKQSTIRTPVAVDQLHCYKYV